MAEWRTGNKTREMVLKTDELYGHDKLFLGPRGRDYGEMLPDPKPYQIANLYPDPNSSYWVLMVEMPEGSVLDIRNEYPHCRYFQYALYRSDPDMGGYTATGEQLLDHNIEPEPGSENPFVPGNSRKGENRDYVAHIANVEKPDDPADREPNTMYAGVGHQIQLVYRVYLPDPGYLGDAGVGLPTCTARLADGTELSSDEVAEQFNTPWTQGAAPGIPLDKWLAMCDDPTNDPELTREVTPARNPPMIERYFNNMWNLAGVFKPWDERLAKYPGHVETGFGGDPVTLFMMGFVSRAFGPVLVIEGRMPQFPDTYSGDDGGLDVMEDWEARYWSLILSQAPPSGKGMDAVSDFQIPLDDDRNYTIVICRPEDRPANATEENGVMWMDWGEEGEGLDDPANRSDFGFLVFRFMYNNENWRYDPTKIEKPGTEAEVMGPYFPRVSYTDKSTFEAGG